MSDSQSSSHNDEHSVTRWIAFLKSGDQSAAQELWIRYVTRLVRLARVRIGSSPRRLADENDAANTVSHDLLMGIEQNRFPDLEDRQDLWQILVMLTEREAVSLRRKELAAKRGGWRVFRESELADANPLQGRAMEQMVGDEPTAEFAALCAEQLTERLATLSFDPILSQIAQAKLSGYSNSEIARRLSLSLRTVERNLAFIRKLWTPEALK
jgi:DNA-directed RNA polymerase specialized sigma24 family protein